MTERTYTVSWLTSVQDRSPTVSSLSWSDLVGRLSDWHVTEDKLAAPRWHSGHLDGGRRKEHVKSLSCLVLDYDDISDARLTRLGVCLAELNLTHLMHTTWSDGLKSGRCVRLVLPLSRDVQVTEYRRLYQTLPADLKSDSDSASGNPTQIWAVPSCSPDRASMLWQETGDLYVVPDSLAYDSAEPAAIPDVLPAELQTLMSKAKEKIWFVPWTSTWLVRPVCPACRQVEPDKAKATAWLTPDLRLKCFRTKRCPAGRQSLAWELWAPMVVPGEYEPVCRPGLKDLIPFGVARVKTAAEARTALYGAVVDLSDRVWTTAVRVRPSGHELVSSTASRPFVMDSPEDGTTQVLHPGDSYQTKVPVRQSGLVRNLGVLHARYGLGKTHTVTNFLQSHTGRSHTFSLPTWDLVNMVETDLMKTGVKVKKVLPVHKVLDNLDLCGNEHLRDNVVRTTQLGLSTRRLVCVGQGCEQRTRCHLFRGWEGDEDGHVLCTHSALQQGSPGVSKTMTGTYILDELPDLIETSRWSLSALKNLVKHAKDWVRDLGPQWEPAFKDLLQQAHDLPLGEFRQHHVMKLPSLPVVLKELPPTPLPPDGQDIYWPSDVGDLLSCLSSGDGVLHLENQVRDGKPSRSLCVSRPWGQRLHVAENLDHPLTIMLTDATAAFLGTDVLQKVFPGRDILWGGVEPTDQPPLFWWSHVNSYYRSTVNHPFLLQQLDQDLAAVVRHHGKTPRKLGIISYHRLCQRLSDSNLDWPCPVVYHWYGNTRGHRDMEDCDLVILLGTPYRNPSDLYLYSKVLGLSPEQHAHLSDRLMEVELMQAAGRARALVRSPGAVSVYYLGSRPKSGWTAFDAKEIILDTPSKV